MLSDRLSDDNREPVERSAMNTLPCRVHAFVCTNDRHGAARSCADGNSALLRSRLKQALKDRGWWGKEARVSTCGCLGLCAQGPNAVIFPGGRVLSGLCPDDAEQVLAAMADALAVPDGFLNDSANPDRGAKPRPGCPGVKPG